MATAMDIGATTARVWLITGVTAAITADAAFTVPAWVIIEEATMAGAVTA
jgi:hypothetical protein